VTETLSLLEHQARRGGKRDAVHVIGTGVTGEPLIGLLADLPKELGIDEETSARNPGEVVGFSFTPQDDQVNLKHLMFDMSNSYACMDYLVKDDG